MLRELATVEYGAMTTKAPNVLGQAAGHGTNTGSTVSLRKAPPAASSNCARQLRVRSVEGYLRPVLPNSGSEGRHRTPPVGSVDIGFFNDPRGAASGPPSRLADLRAWN